MLHIPEAWTHCECGGKCLCYYRSIIYQGGRLMLRIGMRCRSCRKTTMHDDTGMVAYD